MQSLLRLCVLAALPGSCQVKPRQRHAKRVIRVPLIKSEQESRATLTGRLKEHINKLIPQQKF